jgi:hypothetical protein
MNYLEGGNGSSGRKPASNPTRQISVLGLDQTVCGHYFGLLWVEGRKRTAGCGDRTGAKIGSITVAARRRATRGMLGYHGIVLRELGSSSISVA